MTAAVMIGTPAMTGVAMGPAMTIVGATIAASVMPTGDGMIAWMTIAAGTIGVPAMATDGATIAIPGATIDAVESQPTYLAVGLLTGPGFIGAALSGWSFPAGTEQSGQAGGMTPEAATYPGCRFPAEIVSHAAWLYHAHRHRRTAELRSYGVARREVPPEVRHRTSRYLNNRAENSHRPTRRRERQMQRFKSPSRAQRFLSAHAVIHGHFRPRRHLMTGAQYRRVRAKAFRIWQQETCVQTAA